MLSLLRYLPMHRTGDGTAISNHHVKETTKNIKRWLLSHLLKALVDRVDNGALRGYSST